MATPSTLGVVRLWGESGAADLFPRVKQENSNPVVKLWNAASHSQESLRVERDKSEKTYVHHSDKRTPENLVSVLTLSPLCQTHLPRETDPRVLLTWEDIQKMNRY